MINSISATPSQYFTPMATASARSNLSLDSATVHPADVEHTVGPDAAGNPPGLAPIFAALIGGRRQMGDPSGVVPTALSLQARFGGTPTGTNISSAQRANDYDPAGNRVGLDITA
jgi:hypothetical protein